VLAAPSGPLAGPRARAAAAGSRAGASRRPSPCPPRKRDTTDRQPGESPLAKTQVNAVRLQLRAARQEAQEAQEQEAREEAQKRLLELQLALELQREQNQKEQRQYPKAF
jgi:hypothetical protein